MVLWWEAIVSPEARVYLWVNPACIELLKDWTRKLVWWLTSNNEEAYHTIRWFSDMEKKEIELIKEGDIKGIQDFLSKYI